MFACFDTIFQVIDSMSSTSSSPSSSFLTSPTSTPSRSQKSSSRRSSSKPVKRREDLFEQDPPVRRASIAYELPSSRRCKHRRQFCKQENVDHNTSSESSSFGPGSSNQHNDPLYLFKASDLEQHLQNRNRFLKHTPTGEWENEEVDASSESSYVTRNRSPPNNLMNSSTQPRASDPLYVNLEHCWDLIVHQWRMTFDLNPDTDYDNHCITFPEEDLPALRRVWNMRLVQKLRKSGWGLQWFETDLYWLDCSPVSSIEQLILSQFGDPNPERDGREMFVVPQGVTVWNAEANTESVVIFVLDEEEGSWKYTVDRTTLYDVPWGGLPIKSPTTEEFGKYVSLMHRIKKSDHQKKLLREDRYFQPSLYVTTLEEKDVSWIGGVPANVRVLSEVDWLLGAAAGFGRGSRSRFDSGTNRMIYGPFSGISRPILPEARYIRDGGVTTSLKTSHAMGPSQFRGS